MLTQAPNFARLVRLGELLLQQNSSLQAGPFFPVLTSLQDLLVVDHPVLESLTSFAALETARYVWISGNANLVELDLSHLVQVEAQLVIVNNARLDGAALASSLANVSSARHRVAPDQTQALSEPCAWATDEVCDDEVFCAPGTDPVCS